MDLARFALGMSLSPGSRARKRKASDGDDSAPKPEDLDVLRDYLKKEEAELRDQAPAMLNNELVGRMDEPKLLIAKLQLQPSFQEALDAVTSELQAEVDGGAD